MKLRPDQLNAHLRQSLLPIYIISGDEPLLLQETTAEIAQAAKKQNFLEHTVFQVETHFDWEKFLTDAFTCSLFSTKSTIELRFVEQSPNAAAAKALQAYLAHLPSHKILFIVTEKLEANTQKTAWFKGLEAVGGFIQIWPIDKQQLPHWISTRARQKALKLDTQALALLTARVEGNLIAANQALDRLKLVANNGYISADDIRRIISDQARFTVFDFIDALLEGNLVRAYRIFYSLKEEGIEPLLLLNLLTKDIRLIARLNHDITQGTSIEQVLKSIYLPPKKQALLRRVLSRFSIERCHAFVQKALKIDQVLKGAEPGNGWQLLSELCLDFK